VRFFLIEIKPDRIIRSGTKNTLAIDGIISVRRSKTVELSTILLNPSVSSILNKYEGTLPPKRVGSDSTVEGVGVF
jgi:hypothetical protein